MIETATLEMARSLKWPCDYCERGSIGTVNGISHCRAHAWDAMDGRKTKVISIGTKADPDFVDKKLQSCGS